jgi:hypothetical protein
VLLDLYLNNAVWIKAALSPKILGDNIEKAGTYNVLFMVWFDS